MRSRAAFTPPTRPTASSRRRMRRSRRIDRVLRDAREALGTLEHLPHTPDRDLVRQRLEAARTSLGPRAQELRDADEWRRWANASVQEQLIAKAEALRAVGGPG